MGFLGIIPTIRLFSSDPGNGSASSSLQSLGKSGSTEAVDQIDSAQAQKSLESLKLSNSSAAASSKQPSTKESISTVVGGGGGPSHPITVRTSIDTGDGKASNIDPLSQMILKRTGTNSLHNSPLASSAPVSLSNEGNTTTNTTAMRQTSQGDGLARSSSVRMHDRTPSLSQTATAPAPLATTYPHASPIEYTRQHAASSANTKGGGFFSKLLKNKSSSARPTAADESDPSTHDKREEGWKADVFGYMPSFPTPPKYIHVRAHRKQKRELNRVFLAQELDPYGKADRSSTESEDAPAGDTHESRGAIWCARFSHDGRYLATAGEDRVVRVWQVISSPKDRDPEGFENTSDEESVLGDRENFTRTKLHMLGSRRERKRAYAPVFKNAPIREYYGHTSDVLDISWSKNNFLLSSSMDKTVRLWHVDRADCLCSFSHSDFVTSISFHPKDDRFFLSGSLDCKLRLWSIPDKEVAYSKDVPDLITAVAFTPDGLTSIVGCFGGQCLFYDTEGLQFQTQMHVRSSRGRNSKGSKITGIEAFLLPSNIRYNHNQPFDSETKLLVSTNDSRIRLYNLYDKSMEAKFKGHENEQGQISASFSSNGLYIISGSEDERTYIWRADKSSDHKKKDISEYEYFHSNKAMVTVARFAPNESKRILGNSGDAVYDLCDPPPVKLRPKDANSDDTSFRSSESVKLDQNGFPELRPETKKSRHDNGNIIITADSEGYIKVFRQDCGFEARKQFIDTSRKRLSSLALSPTHSWRESLSMSRSRSLRGSSPSSRTGRFNGVYPPTLSESRSFTQLPSPIGSRSSSRRGSMERSEAVRPVISPLATYSRTPHVKSKLSATNYNARRDSEPSPSRSQSSQRSRGNSTSSVDRSRSGKNPRHTGRKGEPMRDEQELVCGNCGSADFNAKRENSAIRLVCANCGTKANQK
ncbi:hypothetical protein TRVA0_006S01750 [Trichomonascus vanleenenianus]|uniref:uncharacterized protein n=1 Tax=Trichomonascus vanleenenianus TaxID=2268995 RepID=UPI003ECA925F